MSGTPPNALTNTPIIVRQFGLRDYESVWKEMQAFTEQRNTTTPDEIWLLQHLPVFTLGLNGTPEHILDAGSIPVVNCDRGGQVTYHGPGQLIVYMLLDIRRRKVGVKALVTKIEQAIIDLLLLEGINGQRREGAPGIYVGNAKIAALGLRIRKGCSYHGLSLNVDMDLEPFSRINPCGYEGLASTQISQWSTSPSLEALSKVLLNTLQAQL